MPKPRQKRSASWVLLFALPSLAQGAEGSIDWAAETLSGSWNGIRGAWSEQGVNAELKFKGTLMSEPVGGIRSGSEYMQNLELKVALDTAKLWNIPDSSAYVHALLNSGGKMNATYVGSLMGVDNTEARENTLRLFQAWFSKNFFASTLSILAGIYPVDSEFYVTDSSGIFLHPSFGMAAEVAQTGRNGPSIYPLAALGMRVKYQPRPTFYAQAAILDADPGEGRKPHWTRINPIHGDGSLFMAEMAYVPGEAHHAAEGIEMESERRAVLTTAQKLEERYEPVGKYAIGYWSYSKTFEDLAANDSAGNPMRRKNRGTYVLMERSLYRARDITRDLAAFFRYGRAEEKVNIFATSTSIGLRMRGLVSGRENDFFGVAATRSRAGENYRLARQAAGDVARVAETALEVTYRAQVAPWLAVQPVAERIINPGLTPAVGNATVIGIRIEISL